MYKTEFASEASVKFFYPDFLEGILNYNNWENLINYRSKHKKLKSEKSIWNDKNKITEGFNKLFSNFKNSILVISYRSEGIPSIPELEAILKRYKSKKNG